MQVTTFQIKTALLASGEVGNTKNHHVWDSTGGDDRIYVHGRENTGGKDHKGAFKVTKILTIHW